MALATKSAKRGTRLADALLMEDLEITSWADLQNTPELVLQYRLELRQERARRAEALTPRNTGA